MIILFNKKKKELRSSIHRKLSIKYRWSIIANSQIRRWKLFCISKAESWKKACIDLSMILLYLFMRVCVFVRVLKKKEKSFACESKWSKKGIVSMWSLWNCIGASESISRMCSTWAEYRDTSRTLKILFLIWMIARYEWLIMHLLRWIEELIIRFEIWKWNMKLCEILEIYIKKSRMFFFSKKILKF